MSIRAALAAAFCVFALDAGAASLVGPTQAREACRAVAESQHGPALARAQRRALSRDVHDIRARIDRQTADCVAADGRAGAMRAADAVHDATLEGIGLDMMASDVVAQLQRSGFRNPSRADASLPELALAAPRPGLEIWNRITQVRAVSADGATFVDVRLAPDTLDGSARVVAIAVTTHSRVAARIAESGIGRTPDRRADLASWSHETRSCEGAVGSVRAVEYRSAPTIEGAELPGTSVLRARFSDGCGPAAAMVLERVGGVPVARAVPGSDSAALRY